jgi:hypothetical protein
MEAHLNDIEVAEFIERCRTGRTDELTFLDPAKYAVHHVDHDPHNNDIRNLMILAHGAHSALHGQNGNGNNVLDRVVAERIVTAQPAASVMTFTLSMTDSSNNFLAEGFVLES